MAFFLKSSKLAFTLNKFYQESKLFYLENKVFRFKNISLLNSSTIQHFSSGPESEITPTSTTEINTQNIKYLKTAIIEQESYNNYFLNLNRLDESLTSLKNEDQITLFEANLLIRSCGSFRFSASAKEKTKLADKIVSTLEKIGVKLNITHYNSLLLVYLENDHPVSFKDFLNILNQKKIQPNYITFQRLLKICCYQGNINAASEILEILKKEDIPINKSIFNSLIYGHGQMKDVQGANDVLNIMEKKGLEPDSESYSNLICAYAAVGDMEKINSIFEMCQQKEISFSDEDLLHIVFVLAKNNQKQYVEDILCKVKKNYGYNTLAKNYIFRLFDNNCDSTGLKIFDTIDVNDNYKKNHGKFIINYYIKNRSASEIMNICKTLEDKILDYNALSYAVEGITRDKNDKLLLSVLEIFKHRKIFLNVSFFWPALINASKISNENLLQVVNAIINLKVDPDHLTIFKVIGPNYVFGNDLEADLENFHKAGLKVDLISEFLLTKFLQTDNFENALKIARIAPFYFQKNIEKNSVVHALANVNDTDLFVEILHSLLHNFNYEGDSLDSSESSIDSDLENAKIVPQDMTKNQNDGKEFVRITLKNWVLKNGCDEVTLIKVLEKMMEKGIGISLDTADFIRTQCNNDKVNALLNKLNNDNVKMLLNNEILAVRNKFPLLIPQVKGSTKAFIMKLKKMKELAEKNEVEKAVELLNDLRNLSDETNEENYAKNKYYSQFLNTLGQSENFEAVQKAYEFGVEMNYIKPSYYFPCVSSLLMRNEIENAVDFYCTKAKETGKLSLYTIIGTKVIELENSDLLQKLVNTFTDVYDEDFALSTLVYLFASLKKEKEIRKLLDSKNFVTSRKSLSLISTFLLRNGSEEIIQCYLNATSGMNNIYRETIYKKLALLHIQNEDLPKLKNLLVKMEEEEIVLSLNLMEEITDFYQKKGEPAPFGQNIAKVKAI